MKSVLLVCCDMLQLRHDHSVQSIHITQWSAMPLLGSMGRLLCSHSVKNTKRVFVWDTPPLSVQCDDGELDHLAWFYLAATEEGPTIAPRQKFGKPQDGPGFS